MNNQNSTYGNQKKKKNNNNGIAAGIGGAAGVAAGVVGGAFAADAFTTDPHEGEVVGEVEPKVEHVNHVHHHTTEVHYHDVEPDFDDNDKAPELFAQIGDGPEDPEPFNPAEPIQPIDEVDPEVSVVSYERVDDGEGGQMDVAVVDVEGEGVLIIDENIDGYADWMAADVNRNGVIDAEEIVDVRDQGISMLPLQEEAHFEDPMLANNDVDLPDYTNDADVDSFMA